jgi:predicted acyltransferase
MRLLRQRADLHSDCDGDRKPVAGYGMNATVTPIIKRIATSSFVLVSGYCLLGLAASYWAIDIRKRRPLITLFTVVGMGIVPHWWYSRWSGSCPTSFTARGSFSRSDLGLASRRGSRW